MTHPSHLRIMACFVPFFLWTEHFLQILTWVLANWFFIQSEAVVINHVVFSEVLIDKFVRIRDSFALSLNEAGQPCIHEQLSRTLGPEPVNYDNPDVMATLAQFGTT